MTEFEMIAKTFQGLEDVLAKELIELGANNVSIGNRMVSFTGDKALLYKANFHLRTAIRILKPFLHFKAETADEVYEICKHIEWEEYMTLSRSFAVDAVVNSDDFKHSKFVAYRVKDAIADYFREKYGKRPNVSVSNPDLTFHIHISHDDCSLSLDSSGESLHKRGYRQDSLEAPINEVLAAGMIMISGWNGCCDFIDPMCGSGTIAIEAALIANNMAPGLFRTQYAFEKWNDFDRDLFESIYNDDSEERSFEHRIYAYDINPKAIAVAKRNAKAAGLLDQIEFRVQDFKDFEPIRKKSIIITNPPYGERIKPDDLSGLYKMIGERLKHAFQGGEAWIISYHYECFDNIGLKPSTKIPLFNGALPCELRKYEIFSGRYDNFRKEGSSLDKKEMVTRRGSTLKHKARQTEKLQESEISGKTPDNGWDKRPIRREEKRKFPKEGEHKFRRNEDSRSFRRNDEQKSGNGNTKRSYNSPSFSRPEKSEPSFGKNRPSSSKKEGRIPHNKRTFSGPRLGEHKPSGRIRKRINNNN